jgi:hypothetical protein
MEATMARTETARCDYARRGMRYSSDLSDRERALISPFLPESRPVGRASQTQFKSGRVPLQEIVNRPDFALPAPKRLDAQPSRR